MLLPVVALLVGVVVALTSGAASQLRCADAARAGARSAALGADDLAVADVARRVAGEGVRVRVDRHDGWVVVTVESTVGPEVPLLGGVVVRGAATTPEEP